MRHAAPLVVMTACLFGAPLPSAAASSAETSSTATTAAVSTVMPSPATMPATVPPPAEPSQPRVLVTTDRPVPRAFVLYENVEIGAFIKPVLQLSSSIVRYIPFRDGDNDTLSGRTTTLVLARFGVEGRITEWISFRSVFERNVGFSLARNGPVGTSVWEGTASLQARENYIRLKRWGFELTGGIVPDPASVDFISDNTLDQFGMDPYVRDPLLVSGFNQGQGFLLRYSRWGATLGLAFTGGNPLVSSSSFGFGGQVSALGTLFSAPVRALASGIPGSDIHLQLFSPSVTYEHEWFDVRLGAQIYDVDVDLTQEDDKSLSGYNLRATAQVKPLPRMLRIFVSGALRSNQQIAVTDVSMRLDNDFTAAVFGAGLDFDYGPFSVGGQYYWIRTEATEDNALFNQYFNVGATYWIWERSVSTGLRWAHSRIDGEDENLPNLINTHSLIGSLRVLL